MYNYKFVRNLGKKFDTESFIAAIEYFENNKDYFEDFEKCLDKHYKFNPSTISSKIVEICLNKLKEAEGANN